MAGMALQCVKDSRFDGQNTAELDSALRMIKQKLLDSRGTDNHIGNQFSTGLAVQVRTLSSADCRVHGFFFCVKCCTTFCNTKVITYTSRL